jgi:hypothetical protein
VTQAIEAAAAAAVATAIATIQVGTAAVKKEALVNLRSFEVDQ